MSNKEFIFECFDFNVYSVAGLKIKKYINSGDLSQLM